MYIVTVLLEQKDIVGPKITIFLVKTIFFSQCTSRMIFFSAQTTEKFGRSYLRIALTRVSPSISSESDAPREVLENACFAQRGVSIIEDSLTRASFGTIDFPRERIACAPMRFTSD